MKSKIAESYMDSKVEEVDDVIKFGAPKLVVRLHNAIRAVELAEQETEERMREKAIKAYCLGCACYENGECIAEPDRCNTREEFIKAMNKG